MSGVIVYALLALLLTVMIVQAFPVECAVSKREGFEDTKKDKLSCPKGTRSFINENGDLQCCSGIVNGRKCEGSISCTFSYSGGSISIPFCGDVMRTNPNPVVDSILSPPTRNITLTPEEKNGGKEFYLNTLNLIYLVYLESILTTPNLSNDMKSEFKKLVTDQNQWNTTYAAKADAIALATEAKYWFEQMLQINLFKNNSATKTNLKNLLPLLVNNNKEINEMFKQSIPELETRLKKENKPF